MEKKFDLVVIGTGTAGSTAAQKCREAGWSVAIVDSRPFGGTCALRGCDPKKVLVGAAELADWSARMRELGVITQPAGIDWPGLMRFKRTFTDPVPAERADSFSESGIEAFRGTARFLDRTRIAVGEDILHAAHVAIAAGAKPMQLGIEGEEYLATSTEFLDLERLPARIVFLGGGFISFEFAHVAARAGAHARIIERETRTLAHFDGPLTARLVDVTREAGIDVELNTAVTAIEKRGNAFTVRGKRGEEPCSFEADLVVHGGGRVPDLDDTNLDAAGVKRVKGGVEVNEYFQSTTNPAVYAAGDSAAAGAPQLTPIASLEGEIVAENLLHGNRRKADFTGFASIVYAIPPLAMCGMTEEKARAQGPRVRVLRGDSTQWYSSRRIAARVSGYCTIVNEDTDEILGAHILGPHAEELVNIFALAIRTKAKASDLRDVLFAYPTGASDIGYML